MKIHSTGHRFSLVLGTYLAIYAILPSSSYPAESDALVIGSGSDLKATDASTKLFTGNEQNDNVLAAGLLGLGVGVGGVILAQAVLDKPDCRYKRFDMGGLFGGNKDCNRRPSYPPRPPYHGGGGYREPHHGRPYRPPPHYEEPQRPYREPYRPSRPYKEPYRPQRPYDHYEEPQRPYRPTKRPYRDPYREPYREPSTPYRNPKPHYAQPAVYRPPSSNHNSGSPYYPDRPIRGRTADIDSEDSKVKLDNEELKDSEEVGRLTNEGNNTGGILSGRVRFGDK